MITRVNERTHTPHDPLTEALGRPVPFEGGLAEDTVIAYWPGLDDYTLDDEQASWTAAQWAQHLEEPLLEHPFAASPKDDRRAIFHLDVRLHPEDRDLSDAEWAETAHRLARAAGIEIPGDHDGCHWIGVQGRPGRLDLIANLIRLDGVWQPRPADLLRRLAGEARRIEHDLRLTRVPIAPQQPATVRAAPTAASQYATVLDQLADEQDGPLAAVRGLVEHTAHRIARQPGAERPGTAHRLEWIARRLHGIQQDLDATATTLRQAAGPTASLPLMPTASPPVPVARSPR
ncbi:relaxase/mobilization nuclease [Streptomyces scopuliridis]|uniref:Relaxase/mobilization nuclease n=1 Tax=Streptomyces scopuliridis TaxID=452529 RepID=A0ACD4ZU89_9ACTN|nr:relaxase/mobilization nuclease [Streptomyces scopuliridis]WSB37540.1 relaxase/mobilization nuclease [Streptomyces scopuliridis]WSC02015.1 relaxase/mobilization nuclease [Streptomyces scopuliridis]WSC04448.1 relaxase/mobilization nuclease [Streptomyces scopuliridis]